MKTDNMNSEDGLVEAVRDAAIVEESRDGRGPWRLVLRAGLIVAALALGVVFLGHALGIDGATDLRERVMAVKDTPWAPFAMIGIFIVLGQTGFPQFVMIGAAVMVFGPFIGFAVSWTGTLISSSIGFALGHYFGAELLRRFGGDMLNGLSERIARHGILTVIVLRNVPAGPFVAVNMGAGLSHISYGKFLLGTALGTLPKMTVIAFLGASFGTLLEGRGALAAGLIVAAAIAWVAIMVWVRRMSRHWPALKPDEADPAREASADSKASTAGSGPSA